MEQIRRDLFLNRLIEQRENGMLKVVLWCTNSKRHEPCVKNFIIKVVKVYLKLDFPSSKVG